MAPLGKGPEAETQILETQPKIFCRKEIRKPPPSPAEHVGTSTRTRTYVRTEVRRFVSRSPPVPWYLRTRTTIFFFSFLFFSFNFLSLMQWRYRTVIAVDTVCLSSCASFWRF